MKKIVVFAGMLGALAAFAAIEPVSPVGGETVQIVPDVQKKVMNLPTYA